MKQLANERFVTLDVFRGLTVFLMIIVNTQGGGALPYKQLMHADWNGCTLTDLVFPSFLFAVGNAMPFAEAKFKVQKNSQVLIRILKRSLLIFVIGFLLGWYATMRWADGHIVFIDPSHVRFMAVLQRIAICYVITALLARVLTFRWLLVCGICFLLLYWFLLSRFGDYTITGNAVRKLDLQVIGINHMYMERGVIFDPEGLLSTVSAVVNVIAGYLTGSYIRSKGKTYNCLYNLALVAAICITVGLGWNMLWSFNKKLWTSSYVVFATGIDLAVLAFIFYLVEILQVKKGFGLLLACGRNPLFIYILSNLTLIILIYPVSKGLVFIDWVNYSLFQKVAPGPFGAFLFSLVFTLLMGLFAWILDKRKIYIRV